MVERKCLLSTAARGSAKLRNVSNPSRDDLERLANRLALLASGDGEADNAGRAVGQMARRLGLSGGDLKQIFLAGAGAPVQKPTERADLLTLRREIQELENALRQAIIDRDAARAEVTNIRIGEYRVKASRRGRFALITALIPVAILAVAGVAMFGPDMSFQRSAPTPEPRQAALDAPKSGVVRSRAALLYHDPDRVSPVVGTLPVGTPLVVHRLLWNMMSQWAQVDSGTISGYVAVTDIELR